MSRLLQLLNEKVATPAESDATDTNFKLFSTAGNLFRLMLIVNADQPVIHTGPQNMVSKMFDSMMEQNPKGIKQLQTVFNKVKKTIAAGKKVTVATKKEYFEQLFPLLLPLTGLDVKPSTLVTNFAGNTPSHLSSQRRHIVLIAKSLLANKEVELNAKDRMLIKGYIAGFDAVDGISSNNDDAPENVEDHTTIHNPSTVPEVEASPIDSAKRIVKNKKDEQLKTMKDQAKIVKTRVKGLTKDTTNELKQLIDTNESSNVFHVNLTGTDSPVSNIINSKIDTFYDKTKSDFGHEVANFSAKLCSSAIKYLNEASGYLNFTQGDVDMTVVKTEDGGIRLSMKVGKTAPSEHQFFMVKTFRTDESGMKIADHEKIQIPLGAQSTGINKKIFRDSLELYKSEEIDKITLRANVDVGGYAWFRYGFVPVDNKQIEQIAHWIEQVGDLIVKALKYDSIHIAKFIDEKSSNKTKGISNLVQLLGAGSSYQAENVVRKLLTECANEFRTKYTTKASYKELGKNIAIANFKDYKISGNVYSISYKALLSIQSLNVDGTKPIPMVRGVYLDWLGELDMKDLDNTNAYLNMKKD